MGRASKKKWQNRVIAEHTTKSKTHERWRKITFGASIFLAIGTLFAVLGLYFFLVKGKPNTMTETAKGKNYIAHVKTSMGNFDIELLGEKSPRTVQQFVGLATEGKSNGLTFHRVIKDFVIQGGDPKGDGTGGNEVQVEEDINDLKNLAGTVAMAKSSGSTKVGSQFFVNLKDNTPLDQAGNKFYPFGRVTSGMDIILKIAQVSVDESDKPLTPVKIITITIDEK